MILKLLSLVDLLAGVFIVLLKFDIGVKIALIIAIILLVKSLIFIKSFVSIIDIAVCVFFFLAIYGYYFPFTIFLSLWLFQKAFFGFFN